MLKSTIIALALLCAPLNAEARPLKPAALHPQCNISMPCEQPYASNPQTVRETRGKYVSQQMGFGAPVVPQRAREVRPTHRTAKAALPYVSHHTAPEPSLPRTVATPVDPDGTYVAPQIVPRPIRYIAGRLVCALNVGAALAERGIKGTGSALAMSYRFWGKSSGGPVPGAVIVSGRPRGGHVAIVSRIENGIVYAWNATGGRRGWHEVQYRHSVIDYRVPG